MSFTPEQQRLEELADRCLAEAGDAMETNEGFLFEAITGAADWEDAKLRLLECYPKLSVSVLADVLHRGLVAAECWGRLTVENEAEAALERDETADFAASDATEIKLEPLAMREALEFWRDKLLLDPEDFNRLDDRAKTRAFAAAGIARGDALKDIYQALLDALEKGTTFEEFKQKAGQYFGAGQDPKSGRWSGGDERRMEVIFRTNLQTAYNVGRYRRQKETAKFFPYLRYTATLDNRVRETHAAMHGKIYPIGHEFWDHWYPPNGFNCRCGAESMTKGEVARLGLEVSDDMPEGVKPDKGFDHHPGKDVWGGLENLSGEAAKFDPLPGLPGPEAYENVPTDLNDAAEGEPPLPVIESKELFRETEDGREPTDADYAEAFRAAFPDEASRDVKDALGEVIHVSPRLFQQDKDKAEGTDSKAGKAGHGEIIPILGRLLRNPLEIWLTPQIDRNGKARISRRYISAWRDENGQNLAGLAVFEIWRGVLQGVSAFIPRKRNRSKTPDPGYANRQRRGILLYRRGVGRPERKEQEEE